MACLASVSRVRCTIYCVLCRSVVQTLHCVLHTVYSILYCIYELRFAVSALVHVGTRRVHAARVRAQGLWILESGQWAVVRLHHLRPPSSLTSKSDWTLDIVCRCRLPAGSFQRPCIVVSFWRYDAACSFVVRTMITSDLPRAAINDQRTLFVFYSALPSYILGQ